MKRPNLLAGALAIVTLGLVASSCGRPTNYEVLSFFFTGVPPLEEETAAIGPGEAESAPTITREQRKAKIRRKRQLELQQALKWTHGPYAAGECDRCHALAASLVFRTVGVPGGSAKPQVKAVGGRLAAPVEKLCLTCHAAKSIEAADDLNLRVHGPVAAGLCTACHSPHQSTRRYMLLHEDNIALCTQCHEVAGLRQRSPVHEDPPAEECVACHNPHMGKTAMILKSEYDEWESY